MTHPRASRLAITARALILFTLACASATACGQRSAREHVAGGKARIDPATGEAIPTDPAARDAWILGGVQAQVPALVAAMQQAHGVDLSSYPAGWLEVRYAANAPQYPEVRDYFTRYAAYADDGEQHLGERVDSVLTQRMRAAGLDDRESSKLRAAFIRGYGRSQGTFFALMRAMKRQAAEAISLHDFLVEIHPRLSWDMSTNTLQFANEADQRAYDYKARQLDAATKAVEAIQERAQAAANAMTTAR